MINLYELPIELEEHIKSKTLKEEMKTIEILYRRGEITEEFYNIQINTFTTEDPK